MPNIPTTMNPIGPLAADGIEGIGLYSPTHRLAAGLGSMNSGHPTIAYSAGQMFAAPFWLPAPATLKNFKIGNVTVAGGAGKKARLGLATWANGVAVGTRYQGGTVAIDSPGAKTLDCSADAVRLPAGWHALLILLEDGMTAERLDAPNNLAQMFLSHHAASSSYVTNSLLQTGIAWGAFPAALGTWTMNNYPLPPLVFIELTP
jgi:hypothetical protein